MRVLVNAASIKEGGPSVVLAKLIAGLRVARPDIEWVVAAPVDILKDIAGKNIAGVAAALDDRSPWQVLTWYEAQLPAIAKEMRCDVLFSLTNYLPRRPLAIPTVLLEQHAGHFSAEFDRLTRAEAPSVVSRVLWRQKRGWVMRSVVKAKVLVVQTAALADAIATSTGRLRSSIRVVPHGPGLVDHTSSVHPRVPSVPWRIGYVAKWGVQKNFETLFRAVRLLNDTGHPARLILTLNPAYAPAARVLALADSMGIGAFVENHGEVPGANIAGLYDDLDAFVFASTCESFGFPMVEAMARGLPIVVAETLENVEITGSAGSTFPPYDAEALAARLREAMRSPESWKALSQASLERGRFFSWQKAAEQTALALDDAVGLSKASRIA
ncbi:MAG: glycosyltransferase [Proteobacteria bacterium]|nr:glycosyltransferase [Pseudomonadota bacterium]